MGAIRFLIVPLFLVMLVVVGASAQQPGTTQYNNVYLPAQGLGDTVPQGRVKWGAVAVGKGGDVGWYLNGHSEEDASERALEQCATSGAIECAVKDVFYNACAAFARVEGGTKWAVTSSDPRLRAFSAIRRDAVSACEEEGGTCRIVKEGCAIQRN